jgi:small multidrug resistance pump
MGLIIGGSIAFSIGGAFLRASEGFTRIIPTFIVAASFVLGSAFLARAVTNGNVSTTIVVGLGIEAAITVAIGLCLLGDRLTISQAVGMLLVAGGVALIHF